MSNNAYPWLNLNRITQHWGGSKNNEYGIDIGLPVGTRISTVISGNIDGLGYYWGGGVVTVRGFVNGAMGRVYYQHLDEIAPGLKVGQPINNGDLVGWSGGQCDGSGRHPSKYTPGCGPHIEVGVNPPWGGIWGTKHNSEKNYDPEPWLHKVAAGSGSTSFGTGNPDFGNPAATTDYKTGGPWGTRIKNTIGPNDNVTVVLVNMDTLFEIANPFVVTGTEHLNILGADVGINVFSGSYVAGVINNFLLMFVALVVRPVLIILGAAVLVKLFFTFIDAQAATETAFSAARLATVLA